MEERNVQLYYFPASYYSQKVLIALQEKEVKYKAVLIDIHNGDQDTPKYMRLNPAGLVPMLQDGDKFVKESEDIVEYIDREFPTDSKLVPDMSTEMGKEVTKWRKIINDISIETITFGVMCHPELSAGGLKFPRLMIKSKTDVLSGLQVKIRQLQDLADEHPDLREAYTAKIGKLQKRTTSWDDKESVAKVLDDLEATMDKIEEQLLKVEADPSRELWLCGQQFTAADINLSILLGRLELLGLTQRYHSADKRPKTQSYWEQVKKRPTVLRVTVNAVRNVMKMRLGRSLKKAIPLLGGLVTLGLAAGLAFAFAQKR